MEILNKDKVFNLLDREDNNNIILSDETVIRLYNDGVIVQELKKYGKDSSFSNCGYLKHTTIKYKDFTDYTEIQEIEYYYKASYYDKDGNKILLNEERRKEKVDYEMMLMHNINGKEEYTILFADTLEIGLNAVKRINKKIKKARKSNVY